MTQSFLHRAALALLTLLLVPGLALAQGRIAGKVVDTDSGEELFGVTVLIAGTTQGTSSGIDGSYQIDGLRPGDYNVQVSYIGYETKLFTGIKVQDGETTRLDITLAEAVLTTDEEVVIVGERPLVDVEQSTSGSTIGRQQIEVAPVRGVEEVVASQAGVVRDPTGVYIRGGRAEETGFIVDGVSAKDPLAGTGFGLDIGSNAFDEVEVTTGGVGAEVGDVTSGVVSVKTRDGGDTFSGSFVHKRDNGGGVLDDWSGSFNEDVYEVTLGGPIVKGKLRFFTSAQVQLADGFTRLAHPDSMQAYDVRSSLVGNDFWTPRTGNRWSGMTKLTYDVRPGMRLQGAYQRSLTINQNTRMLQVTGNESVISPGFQYAFVLQPENANTFTHDTNMAYLKWSHVLGLQSFYEVQLSRLFTRLRSDANGRDWRPEKLDSELDPESIVEYPGDLFLGPDGQPIDPNALFVLPGPGLFNNGGIATNWHDHFAEEWTLRSTFTRYSQDKTFRLDAGFDAKFNDYQWIDIIRPWVGAPIVLSDGSVTSSNRLGQASDVWRVKPARGGLFGTGQVRYRGLIANVGARLEYWFPGKYVDDLVENPDAPILDAIREGYKNDTYSLLGRRFKMRLLPKLRVSFPIRENQVLFFNYGHSTRLPHPTFVYTGLDPFFQDRSFFADLGNPNLDPEVDISYELGLRLQLSSDDVLNVTAFWRDKFDFITVEDVIIKDQTGRETTRAFRVNGDFARIRGIEASYLKRIGNWFRGQVSGSFSRATGLSSTNNDALADFLSRGDIDNTFETPLAWDRPLDLKANATFTYDKERPLFGVPGLNDMKLYLATNFRSGQRYTPVEFVGRQTNPVTGEQDWRPIYERVSDPEKRYSEVGAPWWWWDLSAQKVFSVAGNDLQLTLEVTNLFNQLNSVIVNPVTGKGYPDIDPNNVDWIALRGNSDYDVPVGFRDPRYEDAQTTGLPPFNPARFLPQRHVMLGVSYKF